MRILVTGGAGFIGSNLAEALLQKGDNVTVLDNFNCYYNPQFKKENVLPFLSNKNYKLFEGDITDKELIDRILKENTFDAVVHLAASVGVRNSFQHPGEYRKNNVRGTEVILEAIGKNRIKHFIFASSSSVYGNNSSIPFKEDNVTASPLNPYAQTKKDAEELCKEHKEKYGTNITIFRFFTVYGPKGRPDMAPYIFTASIIKGMPIHIYGDGSAKRDFTYIEDLMKGMVAGIKKPFLYEIMNLGSATPISLLRFIQIIEEITGKKAKIQFGKRYLAEMRNTYANIDKAAHLLGYTPRVDIYEGLTKFIRWFRVNRL